MHLLAPSTGKGQPSRSLGMEPLLSCACPWLATGGENRAEMGPTQCQMSEKGKLLCQPARAAQSVRGLTS